MEEKQKAERNIFIKQDQLQILGSRQQEQQMKMAEQQKIQQQKVLNKYLQKLERDNKERELRRQRPDYNPLEPMHQIPPNKEQQEQPKQVYG